MCAADRGEERGVALGEGVSVCGGCAAAAAATTSGV